MVLLIFLFNGRADLIPVSLNPQQFKSRSLNQGGCKEYVDSRPLDIFMCVCQTELPNILFNEGAARF